jgi:hypothetical protein
MEKQEKRMNGWMNKREVEGTKERKRKKERKEELKIWTAQWNCSLHYYKQAWNSDLWFGPHSDGSCSQHLLTYLLTYLLTELSPSWEATNFAATQELPSIFMEPEVSSPCSKEPSTGPYPKPDRSSPYHHVVSTYLLNYLLTYLLTELSPSWEAANFATTQELPSILWNPKFHHRVQKGPPLVPNLSQIDPVHTIPSYLRSILILSTHLRLSLPSGPFPSGFV